MPVTRTICLGLNYHTAPVALREQLNCSLADLQQLAGNGRFTPITEFALLSTCNRVELYAQVDTAVADPRPLLTEFLASANDLNLNDLAGHLYCKQGWPAIEHLSRVAAGLDSLVLGEPQILGQVTQTYMAAVRAHTICARLSAIFQAAIHAGKRARSETQIGSQSVSISAIAITQAQALIGDLTQHRVLVIGLGEMGQLALKALRARGVGQIDIVNRTLARAQVMAERIHGRAFGLDNLSPALAETDVVISATGSPTPILDVAIIRQIMAQRGQRPLILIDIAVPRDIDPAVGTVPGIHLLDVDDLQGQRDEALCVRQQAVPQVEAIIAAEMDALEKQLQQLTVKPLIADLHQKAETIRRRELGRTMRHLGDVDPQTLAHIQHLSRSLVTKLLHEPTIQLKAHAGNGQMVEYAETVRELFGLPQEKDEI